MSVDEAVKVMTEIWGNEFSDLPYTYKIQDWKQARNVLGEEKIGDTNLYYILLECENCVNFSSYQNTFGSSSQQS